MNSDLNEELEQKSKWSLALLVAQGFGWGSSALRAGHVRLRGRFWLVCASLVAEQRVDLHDRNG